MQDISELLEEIRQQYIAEAPSRIDTIESLMLKLEEEENYSATFEELYRAIHNLKGSAGTHNIHILSKISHHIENKLTSISKIKSAPRDQINKLLEYIDLLRLAIELIEDNEPVFTVIENKLDELISTDDKKGLQVLMVEPSKAIINIAQQILHGHSAKIDYCYDGHDALKKLLLGRYDLLVTNAEAPILNGVALISALKLSEDHKHHTYSILLTSRESRNYTNRNNDPDFTVQKNNHFIESFSEIVEQVINKIKDNTG